MGESWVRNCANCKQAQGSSCGGVISPTKKNTNMCASKALVFVRNHPTKYRAINSERSTESEGETLSCDHKGPFAISLG